MTYDCLLYEVDDHHICWITLNRPEKLNAFNSQLCREFCAALERAERDKMVNVVVVRGAGRGFCSGHDLSEDAEDDFESIYDYRDHYIWQQREFTAAWRICTPVITSIHYCAIGKGFELALFSDITIVTEETRLGYNEMRYGIAAMNFVLPWLVHMKVAKDLILTGREVSAREARDMGLITEVVKAEDLEAVTLKRARLIAAMPREMQRVHKHYLNRVFELQGLTAATDTYQDLMTMLSFCPTKIYEDFTRETLAEGLKSALRTANARYEGLD